MTALPGIALAEWRAQGRGFSFNGQAIRYWTAGQGEGAERSVTVEDCERVTRQLQYVLGNLSGPLMAMLPALLPIIIDKLTPDGQAPQGGLGNGNDLLGMLTKAMAQRS